MHTRCTLSRTAGGPQAGREGAGMERGRVEGGRDGGNKGREGGRKRLCEAGREREWRKGGRIEGEMVNKGTSEEGTERGMDGVRERGEGGSERRKEGAGRDRGSSRERELSKGGVMKKFEDRFQAHLSYSSKDIDVNSDDPAIYISALTNNLLSKPVHFQYPSDVLIFNTVLSFHLRSSCLWYVI